MLILIGEELEDDGRPRKQEKYKQKQACPKHRNKTTRKNTKARATTKTTKQICPLEKDNERQQEVEERPPAKALPSPPNPPSRQPSLSQPILSNLLQKKTEANT